MAKRSNSDRLDGFDGAANMSEYLIAMSLAAVGLLQPRLLSNPF